jgi:hypothetical protein
VADVSQEHLPSPPNKSPAKEVVSDGPVELPDQSQKLNKFDEEVDEGASYYSNCFLFCLLLGVYLILKQLVLLNKNRWKGKESTTKRSDN